jgi:nitroimidazol reductase NimA-like FMN-containing flavoprotein (pyridoxamine 5'-phosphate oxidase superfamily)
MRRSSCEVTDPEAIKKILASSTVGRLATIDQEGYPYITPVNFVYFQGAIYFHCAAQGEKLDNLACNPKVCFEVDRPLAYIEARFNPDNNPCKTHQFYHSVIIRGRARVVPDGDLKTAALNVLVAKHEGHADFPPVTADSPAYSICRVVEIIPERMTAKSELGQDKDPEKRKALAEKLARRGLPGDLEAVSAMGFELTETETDGWRITKLYG